MIFFYPILRFFPNLTFCLYLFQPGSARSYNQFLSPLFQCKPICPIQPNHPQNRPAPVFIRDLQFLSFLKILSAIKILPCFYRLAATKSLPFILNYLYHPYTLSSCKSSSQRKSPLLPPLFARRCIPLMTILLSKALLIS